MIYNNPVVGLRYTSSGTLSGIFVESCDKAEVKNNNVYSLRGAYGSTDNWDLRGIYVKASTNNKVFCNTLYSLGQCMVYEGNCLSTTNSSYGSTTNGILGNAMDNARTGLMLRVSGVIGQQGAATFPSSNTWNNAFTFTNGRTYTFNTTNANSASKLYSLNNTTHLPPIATNMTNSGAAAEYSTASFGLNIATGSAITCPTTFVPVGLMANNSATKSMDAGEVAYAEELKQLLVVASEENVFSASNWLMQRFIYNELYEHSGLREDSTLNAFYTANATTAFGILHTINDSIEAGNDAQAVADNATLNPTNIIEENHKTFNAIYLAHKDSVAGYTAEDSTTLYNIASQCATEGGDAVYQSRNLLMFLANNVIEFIDPCDVSVEHVERSMKTEDTHNMKLYPNPNNGSMVLECNLKDNEMGTLFIYDFTGKLSSKQLLITGTKSLVIDAKHLKAGTYVYEIIVNDKRVKKDKFTIIK